jgi:predicted acylesterase/phospholipase RssA
MSTDWRPRSVSFSSGGVRTIGHMGVVARLQEEGILDDVRAWYGCSGGAISAVFCAVGVSAAWIRNCARYMETAAMSEITEESIANFMSAWGINSGDSYMNLLSRFIDTWEQGASQWTFADLARERHGIFLGLGALNVSAQRYDVLSVETAPTMRIMDAVRASTSIPLFFTPWVDGSGAVYCDGAIIEQFPWRSIPNKDETLVIACSDTEIRDSVVNSITSAVDYLAGIFHTIRRTFRAETPRPRHWIAVNNATIHALDFGLTADERIAFLAEGEAAAAAWIAFMRQAAASRTQRNQPAHEGLSTLSSETPVQDRRSGSRQSQNPVLLPSLPPHPRSESGRARRWSV